LKSVIGTDPFEDPIIVRMTDLIKAPFGERSNPQPRTPRDGLLRRKGSSQ
jgi:hypothetical protein